MLEEAGIGELLSDLLSLNGNAPDLDEWHTMVEKVKAPRPQVKVAIVGKYTSLHDAYISVREALYHAGIKNAHQVDVEWIYSGDLEKGKGWDKLAEVDGVIVPGGFGYRGVEGKILAAKWARENKIPYLGLCLGMQTMTIEYARNVLGWEDANSTEFDNTTTHPVIDLMPDQQALSEVGGTMRLGHYPCVLENGTIAALAYGNPHEPVDERHRHRFEVNNALRDELENAGMVFSGLSPDGRLVEVAEVKGHPFMVGSQYHPEFQSRPNDPHPLFDAFIRATIAHQEEELQEPKAIEPSPVASN